MGPLGRRLARLEARLPGTGLPLRNFEAAWRRLEANPVDLARARALAAAFTEAGITTEADIDRIDVHSPLGDEAVWLIRRLEAYGAVLVDD